LSPEKISRNGFFDQKSTQYAFTQGKAELEKLTGPLRPIDAFSILNLGANPRDDFTIKAETF
jgi:hypothetical protein